MDLSKVSAYRNTTAPAGVSICLALYVAAFPLTGFMLMDLSVIHFGLAPSYPIMAALMLAWFAQPAVLKPKLLHASWAALGVLGLAILSIFQSASIPSGAADFADKTPWVYSITQCMYLTWAIAGFVVLCQLFAMYPSLRYRVLKWHIIVACVACLWGIYQWIAFLFDWNYITLFNNSPYRANLFQQTFMGLKRVNSTMSEPSEFALYLLSVIPLLLLPLSESEEFISNRFRVLALVLTTTVFFMTTSMSGYLCFFAFLGVFVVTGNRWKDRRLMLLITSCLVCFALAAAVFTFGGGRGSLRQVMMERFVGAGDAPDNSTLERWNSVVAGWDMFKGNPIIGVGEGNFGFFYDEFSDAYNMSALPRIYALLPRILAEHGIFGLSLFLLLLYHIFKNRVQDAPSTLRVLLTFAVAVCIFDMFISMAEMDHLFVWVLAAILAAMNDPAIPRAKPQLSNGTSPTLLGTPV